MAWGDDASIGHQKSASWADQRGSSKRGGSKGPNRKWKCEHCGCKKNGWSTWYCLHCQVAWNVPAEAEANGLAVEDVGDGEPRSVGLQPPPGLEN
eukprot:1273538-Pyramimonas_sp.AAC.1